MAASDLQLVQDRGVYKRRQTATGPSKTFLGLAYHGFFKRDRPLLARHVINPTTVGFSYALRAMGRAELPGLSLHYEEWGDGAPILLIAGIPALATSSSSSDPMRRSRSWPAFLAVVSARLSLIVFP
jgi:hypothetical protein